MKLSSRILSVLLALCMILSLAIGGLAAPASENIITAATGYTSADQVEYNTSGYIANWGARGELATFLSTMAQNFYSGDYTYETLSKLNGGTGTSDAPNSDLYEALNALVTSKQTNYTTYDGSGSMDAKNFYHYTDCVSGDTSQVSLFYRGDMVVGPWQSGNDPYNQEHAWPKSKLNNNSQAIGDIMHLRATNSSENSSRGNKAYGSTTDSNYYYPGDSVIGDCARTALYMYVRWSTDASNNMWGSSGVIESLDVLLEWMAADPVDTWEMGRNDAVQSITGTRNVFVDYPELAWQLFGKTAPADLSTPSSGSSATTGTLVTDLSTLSVGDKIIITAAESDFALSTTQNKNNRGQAAIVKTDSKISFGDDVQIITLEAGAVDGTFAFNVGGQYLYAADSGNNYLRTSSYLDENASWLITEVDGIVSIVAQGDNTRATMQYNSGSGLFSCYETASQKALAIYMADATVHTHSYSSNTIDPTCTEGGYTTYTCSCGYSYVDDETEALDHDFVNGVCSRCQLAQPSTITAVLVTDPSTLRAGDQIIITGQGVAYALSTEQKTSNRGAVEITMSEDLSTISFDADAGVQIITLENGTKGGTFAFNVGTGYLYAASSGSNHLKTQTTLNDNGSWSITAADGVISMIAQGTNTRNNLFYNTGKMFSCYANTGSSVTYAAIYVIDDGSGDDCEHSYTSEQTKAPSCTEEGITTYTCSKCGDTYSKAIDALGHDYDDGVTTAPTCTEKGSILYTCTVCEVTKTESIDSLGHSFVDGTCTVCGEQESATVTEGWFPVDLSDITSTDVVIITMTKGDTTWALPNNQGTSTPNAVVVTIDGEVLVVDDADILSWNIYNTNGSLIIRPNGDTKNALYSTTSNNGVRVGTDTNNTWVIDDTYGYLKNVSRGRYLGVYNAQDWRTYTSMHSNIADQTLTFWKWVEAEEEACQHTNTTVVAGKDATCTETGLTEGSVCADCGETLVAQETIPSLGHTEVIDAAVDATCTETGLTEGKHCSVCNTTLVAQTVVPVLGHTEVIDAAVDATCTETGLTEGKHCSVCNTTLVAQTVVPVLGHSYVDGFCTVCGAADPNYVKPIVQPVITVGSPSVSFEGEIRYNIYFSASQLDDVVEVGLALFDTKLENGTVDNADEIIPGYIGENGSYMAQTNGIAPKKMGDAVYFRIYAKLTDGSYVYTAIRGYNAVVYAKNILSKSTDANMKALVVAMLNYGAAAQQSLNYKTDSLMNADLTAEHQALVKGYNTDMMDDLIVVDQSKVGSFAYNSAGYSGRKPSVSFDGAFSINYYFTTTFAPEGDVTLYYWTLADYDACGVLTAGNATGSMTMTNVGDNQFWGNVENIVAKNIDETVFVAAVYTYGGVEYATGVLSYSVGSYCDTMIAAEAGAASQPMTPVCTGAAVYGYYAKQYFAALAQ